VRLGRRVRDGDGRQPLPPAVRRPRRGPLPMSPPIATFPVPYPCGTSFRKSPPPPPPPPAPHPTPRILHLASLLVVDERFSGAQKFTRISPSCAGPSQDDAPLGREQGTVLLHASQREHMNLIRSAAPRPPAPAPSPPPAPRPPLPAPRPPRRSLSPHAPPRPPPASPLRPRPPSPSCARRRSYAGKKLSSLGDLPTHLQKLWGIAVPPWHRSPMGASPSASAGAGASASSASGAGRRGAPAAAATTSRGRGRGARGRGGSGGTRGRGGGGRGRGGARSEAAPAVPAAPVAAPRVPPPRPPEIEGAPSKRTRGALLAASSPSKPKRARAA